MPDTDTTHSVVVTLQSEIQTENGAFETFKAKRDEERTNCIAFYGVSISEGTIRVQKSNIRSVVYL